jgi:ADP-ribosylglycohydrolase
VSALSVDDRALGCLLGGAVGDALGAPFEGLWGELIPEPEALLTDFAEFEGYPRGQWTDDTQLTLATVESVIEEGGIDPERIARAIARLWARNEVIGPGGACTRAAHAFLDGADWTRCGAPVGQAGNGAAMRTAPLGLLFREVEERLAREVGDVSRITHHDSRSVAGGVAIAAAVCHLANAAATGPSALCDVVAHAARSHDPALADLVLSLPRHVDVDLDAAAPWLAWAGMPRPELERPIITPFVVPTVLACLWAVLRHPTSWTAAVSSVIRLGGDVDTTGAITGAIMGTALGPEAIPPHLVERVVDAERIHGLAAEFARLCP